MARTLVFEGNEKKCSVCESGYGQLPIARDVTEFIQGGAIGAGAATVLDMILPRIPVVSRLPVTIRPLLNGGLMILGAMALQRSNPNLATGVGIGGVAVSLYKFIAAIMGRVATVPTAGYGEEEEEGIEGDTGQIEIESTGSTGVIVPIEETEGLGEEEILIE